MLLTRENPTTPTKHQKIDTDVALPVLLKELDHIQAIIGRYDTFFFLMKQLCLGAITAAFGIFLASPFDGVGLLVGVPAFFYTMDYGFRIAFWASYIMRVIEIEDYLHGEVLSTELYCLNKKRSFCSRVAKAFKFYDIFFYLVLAAVIGTWAYFGGGNPWSFALRKCYLF